jgi:hypothetical protein
MMDGMSRGIVVRAYNRVLRPREVWGIGIAEEPIGVFLQPGVRPRVRWLTPSKKGICHADPFAIRKDETLHIFCEEFDYKIDKGRIVYIKLADDSPPSEPRPTIQLPTHMSYPYLLEHQGDVYCIPETYESRKIQLFRAKTFPLEWETVTTLVDNFAGIDPTVFHYEDRWWLTCCDQETGPFDRLFIWHASDLFGTWTPHPANPVKVDLNSSRPAGTPFMHKGHLYRPAQDCSITYGGRVVLNRVTKITTTEFEEEAEVAVAPYADSEYPHGLHTLSSAGSVTVLDGKRTPSYNRFLESMLWRHFSR